MIEMTRPKQRSLYRMYKKAKIQDLNNRNALYNTGSYSRPSYTEMVAELKYDLLKFSTHFDDVMQSEIRAELEGDFLTTISPPKGGASHR